MLLADAISNIGHISTYKKTPAADLECGCEPQIRQNGPQTKPPEMQNFCNHSLLFIPFPHKLPQRMYPTTAPKETANRSLCVALTRNPYAP